MKDSYSDHMMIGAALKRELRCPLWHRIRWQFRPERRAKPTPNLSFCQLSLALASLETFEYLGKTTPNKRQNDNKSNKRQNYSHVIFTLQRPLVQRSSRAFPARLQAPRLHFPAWLSNCFRCCRWVFLGSHPCWFAIQELGQIHVGPAMNQKNGVGNETWAMTVTTGNFTTPHCCSRAMGAIAPPKRRPPWSERRKCLKVRATSGNTGWWS